ncbi:hypothetical protein CbC4_1039 [Sporocytophaga myxococcoides]|uniref:Peptidase S1 domain-containing protein n=1 Tax=Sporocytophaga myxococcoides TaxID=153721 RepID=A0A098LIP4_9BACT|nr:hypothetical protein [Sporocytophaga myxococcoides]GAL86048.1 hypothetical protein CbC4_1039 [Sporocytophaga myxococcoides]
MTLSREDIEPILEKLQNWLSNTNIVGMYIGKKRIAGLNTGQWAVVVHVIQKKQLSDLNKDDFIPTSVEFPMPIPGGGYINESVPTDVVESGPVVEQGSLDNYKRPCPGGFQVEGEAVGLVGTLGVNIEYQGTYRLLSCNHVLSKNGQAQNYVYQPVDSLWKWNGLADVSGYIPLTLYPNRNEPNPEFNEQDLAWCDIDPTLGAPNIYYLGVPKGIRKPKVGERIRLVGAKTGSVQTANIQSITFRCASNFCNTGQWAFYKNLIQLDQVITVSGDSGAAYMADDGYIVGLHMAADSLNSYGCML